MSLYRLLQWLPAFRMMIQRWFINLYMERSLRKLSIAEITEKVQLTGESLLQELDSCLQNEENRHLLRHIIGIELWSQRRLRAAQGEPLELDEVDRYLPPQKESWSSLVRTFQNTRSETVSLIRSFDDTAVKGIYIPHNQFGDLSVRSWIKYLIMHADMEADKLTKKPAE
jgi:flagellin-specific chaperone FliS